jgi:CHAT domain-containing protein
VLRRDDLAFYRTDVGAKALADEVMALRARLDPDFNHKLLPFPAARAYALYQKLVGPAEPLLAGVRHLLIVPDGALQSLPLGVLVTRPPKHDPKTLADHREIAWLARDYAVIVLPAVSSLRALRQFAGAEHALAPFLGVGVDRYRVVAFATHGLMSGELKGLTEPALVLTPPAEATAENDGLLTASKIATLKFNADWIVLSACNTAAEDGAPDAGGLSGLAKAFFYAGARSLLVSHWPVRSDAAVKLTTGAFGELAKDPVIRRAEALRRAMMPMLDPSQPPEFAHPLAWAPFVLAGESGAGR